MSRMYVIQPGDTLFDVAARELGDGSLYTGITTENGSPVDASQLQPGQTVILPSGAASVSSRQPYTMQSGDTLFTIAQRLLSDGNRYTEITSADGLPPVPEQLEVGDIVYLPGEAAPAQPAPGPGAHPTNDQGGFARIVSRDLFSRLFPNPHPIYTYDALLAATKDFPLFCNEGSAELNKREAAAFLANVSHESGALQFVEEQNPPIIYCEPASAAFPCAPGKNYHGRGPIQLSWNFNYGQCGEAIGVDLLQQPELVSHDGKTAFMTALWFWMTSQPPKASCHAAVRIDGFGATINIINGGLECGAAFPNPQALHRIELHQQFCGLLGIDPGPALQC